MACSVVRESLRFVVTDEVVQCSSCRSSETLVVVLLAHWEETRLPELGALTSAVISKRHDTHAYLLAVS